MIHNEEIERVLPVESPIESTWASYSNLFSIIGKYENAYSWIMNHFTQMVGVTKNWGLPNLTFIPSNDPLKEWDKCPFIEVQKMRREIIEKKWNSLSDFLTDTINEGYYGYVFLNQFQVRKSNKNGLHRNFVYGYKGNCFLVADHFDNGKYKTVTVDSALLDEAFAYMNNEEILSQLETDKILNEVYPYILLVKPIDREYSFDPSLLACYVNDLLQSKNSFKCYEYYPNCKNVFGLNNYDFLIEYLDKFIRGNMRLLDQRPFTLVRDHKKMMILRMEYLSNHVLQGKERELSEVRELYTELYMKTANILGLFLKYAVEKDNRYIASIQGRLESLKASEKPVLKKLLDILEP